VTLTVRVQSSQPGRTPNIAAWVLPGRVSELLTERIEQVRQDWPWAGVAIVIRKTEGRQG
jgi:hypothetical protein